MEIPPIPATFSAATTFRKSATEPERVALYVAAGELCGEIEQAVSGDDEGEGRWLTLAGASGCGKTHLAREIAVWAERHHGCYRRKSPPEIMQTRSVRFYACSELARRLRDGDYDLIEKLAGVWLLVLDDIGAERDPNGYLAEQWYALLNARLGKWTVITTNLSADQISERLDERIRSRLWRGRNVLLESNATDWYAPKGGAA
ncbi:ATP-binding protein [Ruficoccus amylovorans]|uniref:ATP-binding protein n=1 Tax=Ruficoccus amylovorans TaxID=1804625 RepID=A0A842HFD2_9BACT|nr:ATP-binding protein [Ruficoccus amylovorans]MBC2594930.1 ATP-binding protein [Ruficoccus amylovorans]